MMSDSDLDRLLNASIYAYDFQVMIGDILDYLRISEETIESQYHTERESIDRRAENGDFWDLPWGYREHLEENAEHRFKISLPLRIRYGALLALVTAVEWSVLNLSHASGKKPKKPEGKNEAVHAVEVLAGRARLECNDLIRDFQALCDVRNCIAHSAGLDQNVRRQQRLRDAIARLEGFSLAEWHFLGSHVAIEKEALDKYIERMKSFVTDLHRAMDAQGLSRPSPQEGPDSML